MITPNKRLDTIKYLESEIVRLKKEAKLELIDQLRNTRNVIEYEIKTMEQFTSIDDNVLLLGHDLVREIERNISNEMIRIKLELEADHDQVKMGEFF